MILGDDLGSERYVNFLGKLEFTNIPYLKAYNIKPFIFGELIFYPPYYSQSLPDALKKYTRGGIGFGFSIPLFIHEMLSIQLYHNAFVFNPIHKGDIARFNIVEIDIGIF